jgi:WD40 repeat protein
MSCEDKTTFIVGTEGGSMFKCSITALGEKSLKSFFDASKGTLRWKQEAISVMENLNSKALGEVKKKVERYCMDKGLKEVSAVNIFDAKPDIKHLFTIPFNLNYEKHLGTVLSVACSPFHRKLYLSSSSDGQIRLYDIS